MITATIYSFLLGPSFLVGNPIMITEVLPHFGSANGGETIRINGKGFEEVANVFFDTIPATDFIVQSDSFIWAVTPKGMIGTVDIRLETFTGFSDLNPKDQFTYLGHSIAYIMDKGSGHILTLDLQTHELKDEISLNPFNYSSMTLAPNRRQLYLLDQEVGTLATYNLISQSLSPIELGLAHCLDFSLTPNGLKAYAIDSKDERFLIIDLSSHSIESTVAIGEQPVSLTVHPTEPKAYILLAGTRPAIQIININNQQLEETIDLPSLPKKMVIHPDGSMGFITTVNDSVLVFNGLTEKIEASIPVGSSPSAMAISSDGQFVYVINSDSKSLSVIDSLKRRVVKTVSSIGENPIDISITANNQTAYIVNRHPGTIYVLDLTTDQIINTIETGYTESGPIILVPDPAPVASFEVIPAPAGTATVFNASTSISAVDQIDSYQWDFGDGTILTTTNPFICHTYFTPGYFNPTLTITMKPRPSDVQTMASNSSILTEGLKAHYSQAIHISPPLPILPVILSVTPANGPITGGNSVNISGGGFTDVQQVLFGSVPAPFTVISEGSIDAIAPSNLEGPVDITVITSHGESVQTYLDIYYYDSIPIAPAPQPLVAPQAPIISLPLPPLNFKGRVKKNHYLNRIEYIHHLKWAPSPDPTVVGYWLYYNGRLIKKIPPQGPFHTKIRHRHKKKPANYELVAVNANGQFSPPVKAKVSSVFTVPITQVRAR